MVDTPVILNSLVLLPRLSRFSERFRRRRRRSAGWDSERRFGPRSKHPKKIAILVGKNDDQWRKTATFHQQELDFPVDFPFIQFWEW